MLKHLVLLWETQITQLLGHTILLGFQHQLGDGAFFMTVVI